MYVRPHTCDLTKLVLILRDIYRCFGVYTTDSRLLCDLRQLYVFFPYGCSCSADETIRIVPCVCFQHLPVIISYGSHCSAGTSCSISHVVNILHKGLRLTVPAFPSQPGCDSGSPPLAVLFLAYSFALDFLLKDTWRRTQVNQRYTSR